MSQISVFEILEYISLESAACLTTGKGWRGSIFIDVPRLAMEVLSESMEKYDRGEKMEWQPGALRPLRMQKKDSMMLKKFEFLPIYINIALQNQ